MKRGDDRQKVLEDALYKKALGYTLDEVVEEYIPIEAQEGESEGENKNKFKLSKRKVTKKVVPPDLSAAKILLEHLSAKKDDFDSLGFDELQAERARLLKLLQEGEDDD